MGLAKQEWEESLMRGWDAPDKFVCADCVEDDCLRGLIEANLASRKCNYCGKGSRGYIAAPVEAIMPAISSALYHYYNDPESASVPYDNEGYDFDITTSTVDALLSISLECNDDLFEDIVSSFHNDLWVETAFGNWAGEHYSDSMSFAWNDFVRTVKHECRYFFSRKIVDEYSEEIPPLAVLKAVGNLAIDFELITKLPTATDLFRVRVRDQDAAWELTAQELGPPPNELAHAGRMNPAGISYFYLGQDRQTAFAEVVAKPPCKAILAEFKTHQELLLLDLCNLPTLPSIFDEDRHQEREMILFLLHFVGEISQPVPKNGQEHIDYVPSQIISEYFAKEFRTNDGEPINGLMYPSTVKPGGTNIVLFPTLQGHKGFEKLAEFVQAKEIAMVDWNQLIDQLS